MLNVKLSIPKYHKTKFTFHNLSKLINNGIYVIVYPSIFLGVILEYPHYCDCCALQLVCCLILQDFGTFVAELQEACNDKTIASKTILKYRDCLFTARKRSLGQGKLLHLSVSHSVHGGGRTWAGTLPPGPGTPLPRPGHTPRGPDTPPRTSTPPGPGTPPAGRYRQQAGGTHPAGMHSCYRMHLHVKHLFYH